MLSEKNRGLYRKEFEHDSCGIGFIADLNGAKSSAIVQKRACRIRGDFLSSQLRRN